jgi:general secretion pathway protein G
MAIQSIASIATGLIAAALFAAGALIMHQILWFRVDSQDDLVSIRLANALASALFAGGFVMARLCVTRNALRSIKSAAIGTVFIFLLTLMGLASYTETIARYRWTYLLQTHVVNQVASARAALRAYAQDCARFPTQEQGLDALCNNPGIAGWAGPYLSRQELVDIWGRPLRYRVFGTRIEVWSVGPDGIDGTDDDVW